MLSEGEETESQEALHGKNRKQLAVKAIRQLLADYKSGRLAEAIDLLHPRIRRAEQLRNWNGFSLSRISRGPNWKTVARNRPMRVLGSHQRLPNKSASSVTSQGQEPAGRSAARSFIESNVCRPKGWLSMP